MIGIGRKQELLRTLGVQHRFRDYSDPDAITSILRGLLERRPP